MVSGVADYHRRLEDASILQLYAFNSPSIAQYHLLNISIQLYVNTPLLSQLSQIVRYRSHPPPDVVPHVLPVDLSHHVVHQNV